MAAKLLKECRWVGTEDKVFYFYNVMGCGVMECRRCVTHSQPALQQKHSTERCDEFEPSGSASNNKCSNLHLGTDAALGCIACMV